MIKAHTSHVDLLERHSRAADTQKLQEELSSLGVQDVAQVEAQLVACCDEETRATLVQELKVQVETGQYHVDSTVLAQRMQGLLMSHPESD